MKSKIYNLMYPLISDEDGYFKHDDLNAYVDKLVEKACIISVTENDELAAFIAYYANDYESKRAFITMAMVSPTAKKMGYGRRLLCFCIADLEYKNFKKCVAEVNEANTAALNVCRKVGFNEVGRNNDYIILEKLLR